MTHEHTPTIAEVIAAVEIETQVPRGVITSPVARTAEAKRARQLAMVVAAEMTGKPRAVIAGRLGVDHSSVGRAVRTYEERIAAGDTTLRSLAKAIAARARVIAAARVRNAISGKAFWPQANRGNSA